MDRRSFLKGMVAGTAGGLLASAGLYAWGGGFQRFISPLGLPKQGPEQYDEMKLVLLGTGCPLPSLYRSKPAQAVLAGSKVFLVDCGAGVADRLFRAGLPAERIDDLFITHQHSDHNSGFIDFLVTRLTGSILPGSRKPLNVYGPGNTERIVGKLEEHLAWDIGLRVAQSGDYKKGAEVRYTQMEDGLIYDRDGVRVTVFPVDHGIVKPAVGFRFQYKDKTIVISGDTRPCENMVKYAKGADVLVHEAYSRRWIDVGVKKFPEKAEKARGIMQYHSSTLEVAEITRRAGVKHLVFTHLMPAPAPAWYFERDWVKGVSDIYDGQVTVGRDLMAF